jgi:hypothetical protein
LDCNDLLSCVESFFYVAIVLLFFCCIFLGTWEIGPPMPTKRGDFAIGIVNDKVVVAGGLGKPTDAKVVGFGANNMVTVQSGIRTSNLSISSPTC